MTISSDVSVAVDISASLWNDVTAWPNLLLAFRKAARGKRGQRAAASFEYRVTDRLVELQHDLETLSYGPGPYVHFYIHEPKQRKISAAPFRDRVVHHALCNVIEPPLDRRFLPASYANRVGKGTHRAVDCLQAFARSHRYVLRADIVKHFPSVDHAILRAELAKVIGDDRVLWLIDQILASGAGVLADEYEMVNFPGDDLFASQRPRGLPIGNLTSQFWSNCYMNPFDWFVVRELRCPAYLRYVDDFALFSDSKRQLWAWKQAIEERLARLRLTIHREATVMPVTEGIAWLGFIVYPGHRRVKARNIVNFRRRLADRINDYQAGRISFGEMDASVQGWINHVRYADAWGLREHVFATTPPIPPPRTSADI
jgi:retron-type reverse transcriptase